MRSAHDIFSRFVVGKTLMRGSALALWLVGGQLTLPACEPSLDLPPVRAEAGGCRVLTTESAALSSAYPAELCAFQERLQAALSLVPEDLPLDYALFATSNASRAKCASEGARTEATACAIDGVAMTSDPFHLHEVVHSTLLSRALEGPSALQEGAADVFGCRGGSDTPVAPTLPLELLADSTAFYAWDGGYTPAASFVSFLLERGEAKFTALLAATNQGTSLAELDRRVRAIYGSPLGELHAAWQAAGPRPYYEVCRPVYLCGSPLLDASPSVTLVRGVAGSLAQGGVARTFVVEAEGVLHVRAATPAPELMVLSCDRDASVFDLSRPDARVIDERAPIHPGRYAIWLRGTILEGDQSEAAAELSVVLE